MARIVAIDVVGNRVYAVEASGSRQPAAEATATFELPAPLTPENAAALGARLRTELSAAGFSATDAVCTLDRSRVALKSLRVPPCPEAELPAIVRFTAESEWPVSKEQAVLDFQAGPTLGDERQVLAAKIPATTVEAVRAMLSSAGLSCKHVGFRPHATFTAWKELTAAPPEGCLLLVTPGADGVELSLMLGEDLLLCRWVPIGAGTGPEGAGGEDNSQLIAAEVRRTTAAFHAQVPEVEVEAVAVCSDHRALVEAVRAATGRSVLPFNPQDKLERVAPEIPRHYFASALGGAWHELAADGWPIDFADPKRPAVARDRRRSLAVLAAVFAVVLAGAGYSALSWKLQRYDDEINTFGSEVARIEQELKKAAPVLKRYEALSGFVAGDPNWLATFEDLSAVFPDTTEAHLLELKATAGDSRKQPTVKLTGRARTQEIVTAAQSDWANDPDRAYAIVSSAKLTANGEGSGDFRHQFDVTLAIHRLPPEQMSKRSTRWQTAAASLKSNGGKQREPVALASAAGPSRTAASTVPRSGAAPSSAPAASPGGSASTGGAEEDPVAKLVAKLKQMKPDEQEKHINTEVKSFLRARVRQLLKESQ